MSAYICDKNVFLYLIDAALTLSRRQICNTSGFDYYHDGQRHEVRHDNAEAQADAANLLLRENIRSVSSRYPNESSATLPGPVDHETITEGDFGGIEVRWLDIDPVQVLHTIACLCYQSCESDDWTKTEAHSLLRSLEQDAIRCLPGYADSEWGAPEPTQAKVYSLAAMARKSRR